MRTDSENFSIQSEFGKSFEIRTTEQQIKDSKHPIVLISDLFEHKRWETEFTDSNVSYRMLFSSKYWRTLLVGITVAICHQLTGINAISTYTYYIDVPNMNHHGFRFIMYLLRFTFSLAMIYVLQVYGRKSLLLAGYLISWLCNWILFQLSEDEFGSGSQGYNAYTKSLAVIIITIFYLSYVMTVGTTTWIYVAETLPQRALGISYCFYHIILAIILYLPDFLVRVVKIVDDYDKFYKSVAILFLFFSAFSIWAYFIVLIFAPETKGLSIQMTLGHYDTFDEHREDSIYNRYGTNSSF